MTKSSSLDFLSYQILEFSEEEKMFHSILLNVDFQKNIGIMNGKMGIILWLFKQYRKKRETAYQDFAFELLDSIDQQINANVFSIPLGFYYGLCGIGWGIEYLIRERFIKLEEDICLSYDPVIQNALLCNKYSNLSIGNGLAGFLLYTLMRIESSFIVPDSQTMFTHKRFILYALDQFTSKSTEEAIFSIVQEKNNEKYPDTVPLFLSAWEYPAILWILGRIIQHQLLVVPTTELLKKFLYPLTLQENFPKYTNNRRLLETVLRSLPQASPS